MELSYWLLHYTFIAHAHFDPLVTVKVLSNPSDSHSFTYHVYPDLPCQKEVMTKIGNAQNQKRLVVGTSYISQGLALLCTSWWKRIVYRAYIIKLHKVKSRNHVAHCWLLRWWPRFVQSTAIASGRGYIIHVIGSCVVMH